jgi:hypothetical protein
MATRKGIFKPKNPKKYYGNPTQIIFRSGWEFNYMMKLDHDPDVIKWSSEEIAIPYVSPLDNKIHRYYPDFEIWKKDGSHLLIEIKPEYQQTAPLVEMTKKGKPSKSSLKQVMTYAVNARKWQAARAWCKQRGITFQVLGETALGLSKYQ